MKPKEPKLNETTGGISESLNKLVAQMTVPSPPMVISKLIWHLILFVNFIVLF